MATKGVELASAYISLSISTDNVPEQVDGVLKKIGNSSSARQAGTRMGQQMGGALERELTGTGKGVSADVWRNIEKDSRGSGSKAANQFFNEFRTPAERTGAMVGLVMGRAIGGGVDLGKTMGSKVESAGSSLGRRMGRTFAVGFSGALALGGVGSIAGVLTSGFDRLSKIDAATKKLDALNKSATKFNKPMIDVKQTVQDVTDVVTGTPFSLDQAFDTAVGGIGAGVTNIKQYMQDIVDAAGFAGGSVGDLGTVFQQVVNKGKLTGEELMQLNERFPATSWIQESYHLTADQFEKMRDDGELTLAMLEKSIEDHAAGMGQKLGEGLGGAVEKMKTSVARIGADLITTVFGGTTGDTSTLTNSINTVTTKFNELDTWIKAHSGEIHQFFVDAADAARPVADIVGDIATTLREHPQLIRDVGVALGTVFVVSKLAGFIGGLNTISGLLGKGGAGGSGILGQLGVLALGGAALNAASGGDPRMSALGLVGGGALLGSNFGPVGTAVGTAVGGGAAITQALANDHGNFADQFNNLHIGPTGPSGSSGPATRPGVNPLDVLGGAGGGTRGGGSLDSLLGLPPGTSSNPGLDGILGVGGGAGPGGVRGGMPSGLPPASSSIAAPLRGNFGAEGWRPTVRSVIAAYGPQVGVKNQKAWEDAIIRQIQTESGGNPGADNPHDSNGRGGRQHVSGLLQFLPTTFAANNISGGGYKDPVAQIAALLPYVMNKYGVDSNGAPLQIGRGVGYATGGNVTGPGGKDNVPAWLSSGEHVLTKADVAAMGGQAGVYAFRDAIHRDNGGPILPGQDITNPGWLMRQYAKKRLIGADNPDIGTGQFNPGVQLDPSMTSIAPFVGPQWWDVRKRLYVEMRKRGESGWWAKREQIDKDAPQIPLPDSNPFGPGSGDLPSGYLPHGFDNGGEILPGQDPRDKNMLEALYSPKSVLNKGGLNLIWPAGQLSAGNFNPNVNLDTSMAAVTSPISTSWLIGLAKMKSDMAHRYERGWWGSTPGLRVPTQDSATIPWPHFAEGGAVPPMQQIPPEVLQQLQAAGIDPASIPPEQLPQLMQQMGAGQSGNGSTGRTEGYIPAGAGYTGKTGGGVAGSLINLGAEAINSAIDAAAQGAAMGANMFAPGSGMAIQMGAQAAKRGVQYGAEMANIGVGALTEILMPFGAPRWLSDVDATSFIPNLGGGSLATTAAEALTQGAGPGSAVDPNTQVHGQGMGAPPGPPPGPVPPPNAGGVAPGPPKPPDPPPGFGGAPPAAPNAPAPPANPQNDPLAFLKGFGIFDSGGVLQPNSGAVNLSKSPEYVFTQSQWDKMGANASYSSAGTTYNIQAMNLDEALRELKKRERRNSGPLMRGKAGL